MKKLLIFTLIPVFSFQIIGFYLFSNVQRILIQKEMEHCRTGMVTLTISRDVYYINLQREGKEIELNGRMYDIKEVREQKDSVVVQAIEDVKEKDLVERVSSALKDDYGSKEKRTVLKIKTLKLFSEDLHVLIFGLDSHDVHYAPEPDRLVQSVYLQVSPPPPEVKII